MVSFYEFFIESTNPNRELYHFTELGSISDILKSNKIHLTLGTGADEFTNNGNDLFYLSTTRSLLGEYQNARKYEKLIQAVIVLDAFKISQNYKIKPINYWGPTFGKDEMEDRVFSKNDSIPALKYIKEIRIYIPPNTDWIEDSNYNKSRLIREIIKHGIPVNLYDNINSFVKGDINKTINSNFRTSFNSYKQIEKYMNWLKNPTKDWEFFRQDEWNYFETEIHNIKRDHTTKAREILNQLAQMIRINKVRTIADLVKKKQNEVSPTN